MIYIIFNALSIISDSVWSVRETDGDVWGGSREQRRDDRNSKIDILKAGCIKTRWERVEGVGERIVDRHCSRRNWVEAMGREYTRKKKICGERSHSRDYRFARNHSFQLTQEKSYAVGSHNETTGPSLKSRGRKTKPSPTWLSAVVAPQRNAPCWTCSSSVSTFINNSPSTLGQRSHRV